MTRHNRYRLVTSNNKPARRGQLFRLFGKQWQLIGWDDRLRVIVAVHAGAAVNIPYAMALEAGYRWRPITAS